MLYSSSVVNYAEPKRRKKESRPRNEEFEVIDDDNMNLKVLICEMVTGLCAAIQIPLQQTWVASLKPRLKAKDMIEKGQWLDDVVISAAQKLLHKQYPLIDVFQLTTSIAAGKADILRGGALQVRSYHWVCLDVEQDKN